MGEGMTLGGDEEVLRLSWLDFLTRDGVTKFLIFITLGAT